MKYLNELTVDELTLVFEKNSKLQEKVFDDMFDNAAFWCSDYLTCWKKGIDYCIGWDRGTYFSCTDQDYFIDGLKKAQETFCFLKDRYNTIIEYTEKLLGKLDYLYYNGSEKNYDRLETRINELIEELENACYKRFMNEYEYCFDSKNQLDYFLEFYVDARMDNTFYVNEEYELFEEVHFIKNYA